MQLRKVHVWDFSRRNVVYTLLSKRKLQWFVDNGRLEGWYDPRFPTVQGIIRRGLTIEALKQFILSQVLILRKLITSRVINTPSLVLEFDSNSSGSQASVFTLCIIGCIKESEPNGVGQAVDYQQEDYRPCLS